MSDPLTAEQLAEIRDRAHKATPGPWNWDGNDLEPRDSHLHGSVISHEVDCMNYCYGGTCRVEMTPDDAEFIAHARADVPRLADEVERLRNEVNALADSCHPVTKAMRVERDAALGKLDAVRQWAELANPNNKAVQKVLAILDAPTEAGEGK